MEEIENFENTYKNIINNLEELSNNKHFEQEYKSKKNNNNIFNIILINNIKKRLQKYNETDKDLIKEHYDSLIFNNNINNYNNSSYFNLYFITSIFEEFKELKKEYYLLDNIDDLLSSKNNIINRIFDDRKLFIKGSFNITFFFIEFYNFINKSVKNFESYSNDKLENKRIEIINFFESYKNNIKGFYDFIYWIIEYLNTAENLYFNEESWIIEKEKEKSEFWNFLDNFESENNYLKKANNLLLNFENNLNLDINNFQKTDKNENNFWLKINTNNISQLNEDIKLLELKISDLNDIILKKDSRIKNLENKLKDFEILQNLILKNNLSNEEDIFDNEIKNLANTIISYNSSYEKIQFENYKYTIIYNNLLTKIKNYILDINKIENLNYNFYENEIKEFSKTINEYLNKSKDIINQEVNIELPNLYNDNINNSNDSISLFKSQIMPISKTRNTLGNIFTNDKKFKKKLFRKQSFLKNEINDKNVSEDNYNLVYIQALVLENYIN